MLWTRNKIVVASLLAVILASAAIGLLAFRAVAQNRASTDSAVPDVYALLLIEDEEPRLLPESRRFAVAERDPSVYRRTQAVLLRSQLVLCAALKEEKVKSLSIIKAQTDSVRWLARNIETAFLENTGVLRVSLGAGSPEERAVLINAVVSAYMGEVIHNQNEAKRKRVEELRRRLQENERQLRQQREVFQRVMTNSTSQSQSDPEDLPLLRKKLLRVRLEKVAAQARLQQRKSDAEQGDKAALAKLEEEIAVLSAQEQLLQKDIEPLKSIRIDTEQLGIAIKEKIHKDLLDRLQFCDVEWNEPSRIRVLQEAEVPDKEKKQ